MIDTALQDLPELIPKMIKMWREGYEAVTQVIDYRSADDFLICARSQGFYQLINRISNTRITPHTGDFRLLDLAVLEW